MPALPPYKPTAGEIRVPKLRWRSRQSGTSGKHAFDYGDAFPPTRAQGSCHGGGRAVLTDNAA